METAGGRPGLPAPLQELARIFKSHAGAELFAVGGMVRNLLLGLPVSDMDIASQAQPQAVLELCKAHGIATVPKGLAFGTVELHFGGLSFEHTTFRADEYAPGGAHRPSRVRFCTCLEQDSLRRDFTINALYQSALSGKIKDPAGGLADLAAGRIRATGPEPARIMQSDAVRILRLARLSAELGFEPEERTFLAARAAVPGLRDISAERARDELSRLLLADARYPGRHSPEANPVLKGLHMLDGLGALGLLLPEVACCRGVLQNPTYHAYDVMEHLLRTAACAPPTLLLRLAGLLHDVAKPVALSERGSMLGHAEAGAGIAREIMQRLKYPARLTQKVQELVGHHMFDLAGEASEGSLRAIFCRLGQETSLRLCELREADVQGSGRVVGKVESAERWRRTLGRMRLEGAPFSEGELRCTGSEIMEWLGLGPSPLVGEVKRRLLVHCARQPAENTPERLRRAAAAIYGEICKG